MCAAIGIFLILGILGTILFPNIAVLWWAALFIGALYYCTNMILQEIDALRREIRGEAPPAADSLPLTERLFHRASPPPSDRQDPQPPADDADK